MSSPQLRAEFARRKALSLQQERRTAALLRGRTTPASGASTDPFKKGDVSAKNFLVECKTTEKKGYRLTREVLHKIKMEAYKQNKIPVLQVDLEGESYAVIRLQDFEQMAHDSGYL